MANLGWVAIKFDLIKKTLMSLHVVLSLVIIIMIEKNRLFVNVI